MIMGIQVRYKNKKRITGEFLGGIISSIIGSGLINSNYYLMS